MDDEEPANQPPLPCPFDKLFPSQFQRDEAFFMQLAYNQAIDAWRRDETPVGAIIEHHGEIIGAAGNMVESTRDPTAHAEILAITQASRALGDWRLNETTLYVTKEPCPMCAGACIMSRIGRVVYATADPKMGFLGGAVSIHETPGLNHRLQIEHGILEEECRELIQAYFRFKRQQTPQRETDN